MKKILLIAAVLFLPACSYMNIDETKDKACDKWKEVGYQCIGYEGYQWGIGGPFGYGGAKVWHSLKRAEAPTVIYSGNIQKWGDEMHVYGPEAKDALKSN